MLTSTYKLRERKSSKAYTKSLKLKLPVQTNDILVFPGWLKHATQPNNTDEDRVVLSINYEGH